MPIGLLGAYPIDELIIRVINQRLESISYVSNIVRESRNVINWTPLNRQIVLTKNAIQRAEAFDTIGNPPGIAYSMTCNIHCHILQSEVEDLPIETELSAFAADVVLAITAPNNWHQFDGLCLNATLASPERKTFAGSFDSITVPVNTLYRVAENDPYSLRC